jgi:large subunit ribosomal protein L18e
MRTGPTSQKLSALIEVLRTSSFAGNVPLWKRLADDLAKPTRQRREVNLSRISRHTKDGEMVVVPGKVLASGELDKKVTIAAWQFSEHALEKIQKANGKAISIEELLKEDPKGKRVRVMG